MGDTRFDLAFPLEVDATHRLRGAAPDRHVRDLIELVLFTSPGERVNRPTFGAGLYDLVFDGAGDAAALRAQHAVQENLQRWLGDVIAVLAVRCTPQDDRLEIQVRYRVLGATRDQLAEFST